MLTRSDVISLHGRKMAAFKGRLYLSLREVATKERVSNMMVKNYIMRGQIREAYIIGNSWAIPADYKLNKLKHGNVKSPTFLEDPSKEKKKLDKPVL